jgi:hypothetical protein
MTKICICFYGLVHRSLKYTYKSIEYNILNVLKQNNIEYDIFLHTFDAKYSNAERCEEYNIPININYYKLLNPSKFLIESYDDFNNNFNFDEYINKYKDPWDNNYSSFKNWIREMYSHLKVTELWENDKDKYDLVLYLRADLMYITPLPIHYLLNQLKFNLYSYDNFDWKAYINYYPDITYIQDKENAWQHWITSGNQEGRILFEFKDKFFSLPWGKHNGLNDLINIGDKYAMIKLGKRINHLHSYMTKIGNNSEQFLKYMQENFNLYNIDLPMLLYRTRACGKHSYELWNNPNLYDIKQKCIKDGGDIKDDFEIIEI